MRARLRHGTALAVGFLLVVQGCGWWRDQSREDEGAGAPQAGPRLPYEVVFEGELPSDLRSYLEQASNANQEIDRPPSSELMLRQRAEADLDRLEAALRAEGYYDGMVRFRIERIAPGEGSMLPSVPGLTAPKPLARVVYRVEPGARYTFAPPRDHRQQQHAHGPHTRSSGPGPGGAGTRPGGARCRGGAAADRSGAGVRPGRDRRARDRRRPPEPAHGGDPAARRRAGGQVRRCRSARHRGDRQPVRPAAPAVPAGRALRHQANRGGAGQSRCHRAVLDRPRGAGRCAHRRGRAADLVRDAPARRPLDRRRPRLQDRRGPGHQRILGEPQHVRRGRAAARRARGQHRAPGGDVQPAQARLLLAPAEPAGRRQRPSRDHGCL